MLQKQSRRGGSRPGAGRPQKDPAHRKRKASVYLVPGDWERLARLGDPEDAIPALLDWYEHQEWAIWREGAGWEMGLYTDWDIAQAARDQMAAEEPDAENGVRPWPVCPPEALIG